MSEDRLIGVNRRQFLQSGLSLGAVAAAGSISATELPANGSDDRAYWIQVLERISEPVLRALSHGKLKQEMPVEAPHGNVAERRLFTHLEALGRLLSGIAPWLEGGPTSGSESALRDRYAEWSRAGIASATDPASPDFMNFSRGGQPVVDTAFLGLAILRAPNELWRKLDVKTQRNVIHAFESSRQILPGYNNWLLFSAVVEAALLFMGERWDPMRVDYAIRAVNTWYKGDGVYGDGPDFHWDYYNSFVIHPMLLTVLDTVSRARSTWDAFQPAVLARARRYAAIQERLIGPDGAFPPIGRSLCYRFGAFHLLAEISLREQLPDDVSPEQVRSALTAVMRRMIDAPGTFNPQGWLRVGFYGHQPEIAEPYISTGSLYLCSAAWLPLGLTPTNAFWARPGLPWTAKRIWMGKDVKPDHAISK